MTTTICKTTVDTLNANDNVERKLIEPVKHGLKHFENAHRDFFKNKTEQRNELRSLFLELESKLKEQLESMKECDLVLLEQEQRTLNDLVKDLQQVSNDLDVVIGEIMDYEACYGMTDEHRENTPEECHKNVWIAFGRIEREIELNDMIQTVIGKKDLVPLIHG